MEFDLFCMGGCSVDFVVKTPRLPVRDEKLLVEYCGREAGGLVANTACAAARLGLITGWSGLVGDDENGQIVLQDFARFGVNVSYATVLSGSATDFTVILVDPKGDRTILVVPVIKKSLPFSPDTLKALNRARIGYSIPHEPDWFQRFSSSVREGGGKVAVDLEGSSPVSGLDLDAVLKMADFTFCSLDGLELGTGTREPAEGAGKLLDMGQEMVIVTLGKAGSAVFTRKERYWSPGFSVNVVDTTGAGDCFHAAFLTGLQAGWPLEKILRFANAAAALSVQSMGARRSLPIPAEIEAFLIRQGDH
jgi:sugar/nucleoside kinase (ribokinase family)